MKAFEYKKETVSISETYLEDHLNELGAQGWKLIHIEGRSYFEDYRYDLVLIRPKQ
jgi:FMN-dependent NADH-azoreductase